MFRVYTASDFLYELHRTLPKCNFTLELLISEFDLISLEVPILDLINKKINVTIVISALNQKKSLRLVNLLNRIAHSGGIVYWNTDTQLYENDVHFVLQDKELAIKKSDFYTGEGTEGKLVFLNQLFDSSRAQANQIELLTGEIVMNFKADKTYVKRNSEVVLNWDIKNAHHISLVDHVENAEPNGKKILLIKEDSLFKLVARNRDSSVEKHLVVKVIKSNSLEITVEAYDNYLKEYVLLKSIENDQYTFLAFYEQKIKLSWVSNSIGALSEKLLGTLPIEGDHNFTLSRSFDFRFKFESIYGTQYTAVKVKPVQEKEEEEIKEEVSPSFFATLFRYFKK